MSNVTMILLALAGLIVLVFIAGVFMRREYDVQCETIINAPLPEVFEYLKHIRNQDNYNKWLMIDPGMKKEFKGVDGTIGFIYSWDGNKKAGQGEQEIKAISEGERIAMELRFVRPFSGVSNAVMTTLLISGNQTKVVWRTSSKMKYPMNIMVSFVKKMLTKDLQQSLLLLKAILEK